MKYEASKTDFMDAIVAFDRDKGVGHRTRSGLRIKSANVEKQWNLWNEMTIAAKERRIVFPVRARRDLQSAKEYIARYDKREEKRLDIPPLNQLPSF